MINQRKFLQRLAIAGISVSIEVANIRGQFQQAIGLGNALPSRK